MVEEKISELSDKVIDASRLFAEELLRDVVDEANLRGDIDFQCIIFSLYAWVIHVLSSYGWDKDELILEMDTYFANIKREVC